MSDLTVPVAVTMQIDADTAASWVEAVIASAENHGRASEPDHEVGDLQEFLRLLVTHAAPSAIAAALAEWSESHEWWAPTPAPPRLDRDRWNLED